jgi:RNA polymerase sigma factor (sigma-70 family)
MLSSPESPDRDDTARAQFTTTHWSVVSAAAAADSDQAHEALEALCATYWYPIYAFLRRKGLNRHEAEDLTQDFFAGRVATKAIFKGINAERGKFRTWLLNSVQNLLHNERDRQRAQKRGGAYVHVPLDLTAADERYVAEAGHDLAPERFYDRAWAATLMERVLDDLRTSYERTGRGPLFKELKSFLPGGFIREPTETIAQRLGKTEAAVKMAVSRLRREYGQRLRLEIERTVSDPSEVKAELSYLLNAVRS